MLSPITVTPTHLLLVCFIGAASSTQRGDSNQMLQPAVQPEITLEEEGITTVESINMTLFNWLYNTTENVTYLTICTQDELIKDGENVTTNPTLLYQHEEGKLYNIEGLVLEDNSSTCSLFTMNGSVPLAENKTFYELNLIVTNDKRTIYRSGGIAFGMPVVTSTLSCHGEAYTRVAGVTSDITFQLDNFCLDDSQQSGDESVCYLEGKFSSSYLCYTTKDQPELQICLQGSSLSTADEDNDLLTISYLAYGSDKDAHLEFKGEEHADSMEAIIWKDGISSATSCLNTSCTIQNFKPGFVQYDVCAVILVNGVANTTSTSSITDLDADAFAYTGLPLLQFEYTNANQERYYTAYLVNGTSPDISVDRTTAVDCSAVPSNKTCHGFFETDCGADLKIAVEYSNAEMDTEGNKIIFSCHQITER